ncbi:MAG: molybdopterin-dependent oxidoreductase [Deltaproteobacteria bacterium]|nr:molybdopterin-dependent oxidoreductase [Deltaproteobacteria bacterium]
MSFIGTDRRDFIKSISKWIGGLGLLLGSSGVFARESNAQSERKMASKDVDYSDLKNQNPKDVDVNNLKITFLNDFGTMGLEDYSPQIADWRFLVDGHVQRDLKITYEELLALNFIERPVLLICPGFFANHGIWKGVSVKTLFKLASPKEGATHVTFRGPEGNYGKVTRVPIDEAMADKVFVAYQVNGEKLPQKNGFPLRLVAEGYYGYDWVKYVYKMTVDSIATEG